MEYVLYVETKPTFTHNVTTVKKQTMLDGMQYPRTFYYARVKFSNFYVVPVAWHASKQPCTYLHEVEKYEWVRSSADHFYLCFLLHFSTMSLRLRTGIRFKNMRTIIQTESGECGLACLTMIASHYGHQMDLAELRRRFSFGVRGATLAQMIQDSSVLKLSARPVRVEIEQMSLLQFPFIAHWDLNHFVVVKKISRSLFREPMVAILDPAIGERELSLKEVSRHFTGVALEVIPTDDFERKDETKKVPISSLTGKVRGLSTAIFQILVLAVALELFALAAPLFSQLVIDEAIITGDMDFMAVLVVGFGLLLAIRTSIDLARSWFLMRWTIDVGLQWSSRVFNHLLRLPISFYEKRHLGDIVSRFSSMDAIQSTLTALFVESVMDAIMVLMALAMMFFYSPSLALVVCICAGLYGCLRWIFYYPLKAASQERIILSAKEQSNFLESIRAIAPLKLFGREAERCAQWQNYKLDVSNRDVQTQKLTMTFKVLTVTISSAQNLLVFYLGAKQVIGNGITLGMLLAFTSYAGMFSSRVFNLIDIFVRFKMLSLHSERLADLVLTETEKNLDRETDIQSVSPAITLRNVSFRYSESEPYILSNVSMEIGAMEKVALVGPSGCGKSTLAKIMIGLLVPTEGEVLIGGIPLNQIGLRSFRKMVGTVMQNDVLLSGTIGENIGFFDTHIDFEAVEKFAQLADIHDDICKMPMGYQTLVGELGSSLSGGQKQRILLARALYKLPKILALDEATSHLDIVTERKIAKALEKLILTQVIIAHRPQAIKTATRIIKIEAGKIIEISHAQVDETNLALV